MVVDLKPLTQTGTTITWAYWGDGSFLRSLAEADLLVNCTPLGTKGGENGGKPAVDPSLIEKKTTVFDLVYNPTETPLVAAAKARGANAVSGLGMLVYQAAESFRLWTGAEADTKAMLAAGTKGAGCVMDAVLPLLALSNWGLVVAIGFMFVIVAFISYVVLQGTRTQMVWRERAAQGDVDVIRTLVARRDRALEDDAHAEGHRHRRLARRPERAAPRCHPRQRPRHRDGRGRVRARQRRAPAR